MKCSGEPYHEDFFSYNEFNKYNTKRHKVLFNLYAMDDIMTTKTSPPKLELRDCIFKFFVNKLDALIQVETNNFDLN